MKLSGELGYKVRYDVEHDLFHAQNVFNDEYITPTFVEYVQKLEKENAELKSKVGLSIDCEKAQKNGKLCLGYGGDEDEPCERCKNCIKCECGYYQLGETEKDAQLTKAKEIIQTFLGLMQTFGYSPSMDKFITEAEQFLKECE